MNLNTLTEAWIRQHASPESFQRGVEYYDQGAVDSLVRRGDMVQAEVEGSDVEPYAVTVTFLAEDEVRADCTCPYDWGGWCKHIVATLLACRREPESIEERTPLESLLAPLEAQELRALVLRLVERDPRLIDIVEAEMSGVHPAPAEVAAPPAALPSVDPNALRRQLRSALRGSRRGRYYDDYDSGVPGEIYDLMNQAQARVEAGDGRGALTILEILTEEFDNPFETYDDSDGEIGSFYEDLGPVWTEAILTAQLAPEERRAWAKKLEGWQHELEDYGVEGTLDAAIEAARQHWDGPALLRVLEGGEISEKGVWEDEAPDCADDLAVARLNVLERQERFQEALYLSEAEGQTARYTALLVRLGRIAEATDYALQYFGTTDEALSLAKVLQERNAVAEALRVGERGLDLEGAKAHLAPWLRDLALQQDRTHLAIRAGTIAVKESPALDAYTKVQEVAGDGWPALREDLLVHLRRPTSYVSAGAIDILLHEGLIADALDRVEHSYDYYLLGRVVEAAIPTYPDRVIPICRKQAESIMDAGKANAYDHAAEWLARAKAAYQASGRMAEWADYHASLLNLHQRKYKLMPMLRALGSR